MKRETIAGALDALDVRYIEEAAQFRRRRRWWVPATAVAAGVAVFVAGVRMSRLPAPPVPVDEQAATTTTATEVFADPVRYDELALPQGTPGPQPVQAGSADVVAFDEAMLADCSLIVEGTVTGITVREHAFDTASDKFESGGVLHNRLSTIVYEVAVAKTWYGDDCSGTTIQIEDACYPTEQSAAIQIGRRYVLPLREDGGALYAQADYVAGDVARVSSYANLYPFHPQIEVTLDGAYIVTTDWPTLTSARARVIVTDREDDFVMELRLIDETTFSETFSTLIAANL